MGLVLLLLLGGGLSIACPTDAAGGFLVPWLIATQNSSNWTPRAATPVARAREYLGGEFGGHCGCAVVAGEPKVGRGKMTECPILGSLPLLAADDRGGRGGEGQEGTRPELTAWLQGQWQCSG